MKPAFTPARAALALVALLATAACSSPPKTDTNETPVTQGSAAEPPQGSAAEPTAPAAGACTTDADCRVVADYCTGCDCRVLGKGDPDPTCDGPGVRCVADPCMGKSAVCDAGKCVEGARGK